ncbi:MAG: glycosyltransferase family 2 protein [Gemmataceae bacterium]
MNPLPVTVLIAAKNERVNLPKCLAAVIGRAVRVVVLDSHSTDGSADIARECGAEVVQFDHRGGYPKKRQWALDTLDIRTDWVFLLDADEVVPQALWDEVGRAIAEPTTPAAFLITKGFHFLGQRFRYGGFSFAAVLLFRKGRARFERLVDDPAGGLDMEVHERVIVDGPIGRLRPPLVHDDFKGLEAYLDRHNKYSTWEARLRHRFLTTGEYGEQSVRPRLFGNAQERRRWLKKVAVRMPFEPCLWFLYHYLFKLGVLEGRRGRIACRIRAQYISDVRAKVYELATGCSERHTPDTQPGGS